MFPYPSGNLHMGHVRVYSISDCLARFQSLLGYKVLHPIGWDAFGLPAENAAIERKENPKDWTYRNIEVMRQQLIDFGCSFNWDREFATCDPNYYRWTQFLFLKLFEHKLAYQKQQYVNWDPVDCTVLAKEQIDSDGRSWRSGSKVELRPLKQWFLQTSRFAKSMSDGLQHLPKWDGIAGIQNGWIGTCEVYKFYLPFAKAVKINALNKLDKCFELCVSSPMHFLTAQKIYVKSTHILSKQCSNDNSLAVVNPFKSEVLQVVINDNFEYPQFLDASLDCCDSAIDVNCHSANEQYDEMLQSAAERGFGAYLTSAKLHQDWVVSRQRYWGTPIPIIHCFNCGAMPVSYDELPVQLPELTNKGFQRGDVASLLHATDWLNVKCPCCGNTACRETDTLDTFFDSAWYFLRYIDPHNSNLPFDSAVANQFMPVDVYVGGKEHACLHLYYARFLCHFLHQIGVLTYAEPFTYLLPQGQVKAPTLISNNTGEYLQKDRVTLTEYGMVDSATGETVTEKWEKMSKSKHNGISPHQVISKYGADMTRLLLMFASSPRSDINWRTNDFQGLSRWMSRLLSICQKFTEIRNKYSASQAACNKDELESIEVDDYEQWEAEVRRNYNYCVRHAWFNMFEGHVTRSVIARLQSLTKALAVVELSACFSSILLICKYCLALSGRCNLVECRI